jgi:NAD(P)-dependent dehydrogenase (short-subunit alcohol dehydrogenase family)
MAPQSEKVYVVTGALGSIGQAMCLQLAQTGGTVVMVVRDEARAKPVRDQIAKASGNARIETAACDLGSLDSVRKAAAELKRRFSRIDVLINSAAAYSAARKTTRDGLEMQMGVNHLAAFLLTNLLKEPLEAARGRVVMMSMPSKEPLRFDDLMLEKSYSGMTAYGMSKAANLYFARELAERWKGKVTANAVYPGFVRSTLIAEAPLPIRIAFKILAKEPEVGADTAVYLATSPELASQTGQFFQKRQSKPFPKGSEDALARKRLWEHSARLVRLPA